MDPRHRLGHMDPRHRLGHMDPRHRPPVSRPNSKAPPLSSANNNNTTMSLCQQQPRLPDNNISRRANNNNISLQGPSSPALLSRPRDCCADGVPLPLLCESQTTIKACWTCGRNCTRWTSPIRSPEIRKKCRKCKNNYKVRVRVNGSVRFKGFVQNGRKPYKIQTQTLWIGETGRDLKT